MAIRETVTTTTHVLSSHRRQVISFTLVWTALTLLIGAATFVAIYATTGVIMNTSQSGSQPSGQSNPAIPAVVAYNAASGPTNTPTLGAIASNTPLSPIQNASRNSAQVGAIQSAPAVALQVTATSVPGGSAPTAAAPSGGASPATTAPTQAANLTPTIIPVKDNAFNLGIQVQENADAKTYDLWMQMVGPQLKLGWLKEQVVWADLEKTKGSIDFGTLDVTLPLAAKYHIKVLLSIVDAPNWAREKGANLTLHGPPADPQDFVNFVSAIAKRYPNEIHAIEVWNEENLDREWASPKGLQASQYVALLSATYQAVKAIDQNIIIVSGALSPTSTSNPPKWYDDFVYMTSLINAGMLKYADCVGAHHNGINLPPTVEWQQAPQDPKGQRSHFRGPYDNPHHEWSFKSTLEQYHQDIAAAGSNLKLCVTEFGWASMGGINLASGQQAPPPVGFEFAADNTLADQAQYIHDAIQEMMGWGWVQLAFVWNLNYGAQSGWAVTGGNGNNTPYSILGPGFSQRPAWQVIVNFDFADQPRTASP